MKQTSIVDAYQLAVLPKCTFIIIFIPLVPCFSGLFFWFGIEGANKLLKKYAGIQARAYTAYNYYDENDNFLANS